MINYTSGALVDVERAPFHEDASRLSAAISNALNSPLIQLYCSGIYALLIFMAHPSKWNGI
jgi:hypothetical protein